MNEILVSVLMTAFNRENFIAVAIESVLSSTYDNFELIIVDDCSTDQTVTIARAYAKNDRRIILHVNERNLGDYPNRNKAASYAKGKYIKYLDSDDVMSPICLERMVCEMEKFPRCGFGITSRSQTIVQVHEIENSFGVHFFKRGILDLGPSASIIKRDIFLKEEGFWELRCVSDFEFWLRLSLKYPLVELEKDLVFWRQHDQQEISFNSHQLQTLEYTITIIEDKLALSKLSHSEKLLIMSRYRKETMRYLIKNVFSLGVNKFFYFKRKNKLRFNDAV